MSSGGAVWYGAACRVVSCRVVSCRVVSCRVVSRRVASCRVVSRRVASCHITSRERLRETDERTSPSLVASVAQAMIEPTYLRLDLGLSLGLAGCELGRSRG